MKRCGKTELHKPHEWIDVALRKNCDGRTANAPMVGVCTVAELRAALDEEQDWAVVTVAVERNGHTEVSALATPEPDRPKGKPVVTLFNRQPLDSPTRTVVEAMREYDTARVAQLCEALGEPYETPDGHGMRAYTWPEIVSLAASRDKVWRRLLHRIEEVDPQWLDQWRKGEVR